MLVLTHAVSKQATQEAAATPDFAKESAWCGDSGHAPRLPHLHDRTPDDTSTKDDVLSPLHDEPFGQLGWHAAHKALTTPPALAAGSATACAAGTTTHSPACHPPSCSSSVEGDHAQPVHYPTTMRIICSFAITPALTLNVHWLCNDPCTILDGNCLATCSCTPSHAL